MQELSMREILVTRLELERKINEGRLFLKKNREQLAKLQENCTHPCNHGRCDYCGADLS